MTDTRLRIFATAFIAAAFALMAFVAFRSCTKEPEPVFTVHTKSKRTADTAATVNVPQRIESVKTMQIVYRYRNIHDTTTIIDSCNFIAQSDTVIGAKGTRFMVTFDSKSKAFSVPYLQEKADTTITIRDSVTVTREIEQQGSFWSDVGKVAGGVVGGILLSMGLR